MRQLYKTIISVCIARKEAELNCHDCQYYGRQCNNVKSLGTVTVDRPSDLETEYLWRY